MRQAVVSKERLESGGKRALSSATPGQGERGRALPLGAVRPFEAGNGSGRRMVKEEDNRNAGAEAQPRTEQGDARNYPATRPSTWTDARSIELPRDEAIHVDGRPPDGEDVGTVPPCSRSKLLPASLRRSRRHVP